MDKRNLISIGALGAMVFFAFGSVDEGDSDFSTINLERPADVAPAAAAPASAGGGTGIAECDEYLKRYRCYLGKLGQDTSSADQMESGYKQGAALSPDSKKMIGDSCTQALDMMKSSLDQQGC